MANFKPLKITQKGKNLQAKVQTGGTLSFTAISLGSGTWPVDHEVLSMASLVNFKRNIPLTEVKRIDPDKYHVQGVINQEHLLFSGFSLKEIGLHATDPDEGEILFQVTNAEYGDYIPSSTEEVAYSYVINLVITIGDDINVSFTINPAAAITKSDMQNHELLQLNPAGFDPRKIKHLSDAQAKKWEDHTNNSEYHFTLTERNKLSGIASQANNYTHPSSHPATIISQDSTHRFITDTERSKLAEIDSRANNYVHPSNHPASMVSQDPTHRFMTDTERNKLAGIESQANKYVHPSSHPLSMVTGAGSAASKNTGHGNGLDADTLDGKHASAFLTADNIQSSATDIGWEKRPSGIIEQWGYITLGGHKSGNIVFPIAFPNACLNISVSVGFAAAITSDASAGFFNKSQTGCTIQNYCYQAGIIYYRAIGN